MMKPRTGWPALIAGALTAAAFILPLAESPTGAALTWTQSATPFVFASCAAFAALLAVLRDLRSGMFVWAFTVLGALAALAPLVLLDELGGSIDASLWRAGFWSYLAALALLATLSIESVSNWSAAQPVSPARRRAGAIVLALWVLLMWQLLVQALAVPITLLPSPVTILRTLWSGLAILSGDAYRTLVQSVLVGGLLGGGVGAWIVAIASAAGVRQDRLSSTAHTALCLPLLAMVPGAWLVGGPGWLTEAVIVAVLTALATVSRASSGSGHRPRKATTDRQNVLLAWAGSMPTALTTALVAEFLGGSGGLGHRLALEAGQGNTGPAWATALLTLALGAALTCAVQAAARRYARKVAPHTHADLPPTR